MQARYPNLSKPLVIRGKVFKNRMITAPLGYGPEDNTGYYLHRANIEYYEALARGGTARVITGDHPVNRHNAGYGGKRLDFYSPRDFGPPGAGGADLGLSMESDKSIEFLVRRCHQHDALVFTEFDHGGMFERGDGVLPTFSPSEYVRPDGTVVPEMTKEQIERTYDDFVKCCVQAKKLGLDGVLIHGGHAHIHDQFRSRHTNRRTDEYGGSLENRCRFTIESLRRIRDAVGEDFLIEYRFSVEELWPEGDGITVDESVEFLKLLEADGSVDIFHVSTGVHFDPVANQTTTTPPFRRNFYNEDACRKIKAAGIKTPIAICNGVNDPEKAEQIIAEGTADFVTAARQFNISDPYFPRKVLEGKGEYCNTCIRCYGCYEGNECGVNPINPERYFTDLVWKLDKSENPRKVVIVGGGIAGMKAAETAADKGHDVTLIEKTGRLGGLTRYADNDSIKSDIKRFRDNMIFRMYDKENIKVLLNTEATPELIKELDPYALIIAVGSHPAVPNVPGTGKPHALNVMEAFDQPERVGDTVAVVGGGITGCELALHLANEGKKVTIINRRGVLAPHEHLMMAMYNPIPMMLQDFAAYERPVDVLYNCDCRAVLDNGVRCVDSDGGEVVVNADTVIFASGMKPNSDEARKFLGLAPYVKMVGDCRRVGKIKHCTTSGYYAAIGIDK